jgi:hypothetical protein
MYDGKALWNYIKNQNVKILSSPSKRKAAIKGKKIWLKKNNIECEAIFEEQKQKYANENSILIDDYEKNIQKWENAGGIGILHKSTILTIKELTYYGIIS